MRGMRTTVYTHARITRTTWLCINDRQKRKKKKTSQRRIASKNVLSPAQDCVVVDDVFTD